MTEFYRLRDAGLGRMRAKEYGSALELFKWCLDNAQDVRLLDQTEVRDSMAQCYFASARYTEALTLSRAVLDMFHAVAPEDEERRYPVQNRIEQCLTKLADAKATNLSQSANAKYNAKAWEEAMRLWKEASKERATKDDRWNTVQLLNIALCLYHLDRFGAAAAAIERADVLVRAGSLKNEEDLAEKFAHARSQILVANECAEAYRLLDESSAAIDREDYIAAEGYAEDALAIVEACSVKRECYIGARVFDALATACYKQTRTREAVDFWREGRRLAERWAGRDQPNLAKRCRDMLERCR